MAETKEAKQIRWKIWYANNRATRLEQQRLRRLNQPEVVRLERRTSARKRRYTVTESQLHQKFFDQGGKCQICSNEITLDPVDRTKYVNVDHCHTTGNVRGLLCGNCNRGLGQFKDQEHLLIRAASYLRTYLNG